MVMNEPKYAIINQGVVLSRFSSREDAEKALEKVSNPKAFKLVRITHREVRQYYRRVNRRRKKLGLEPLNPLKW